jgi:enterochelin esterase-like enzyme
MALGASATAATPVARPRSGRLERLESVPSRFVAPRHVDVWLPPGYAPDRPHAVVYMHDGQMLFDAATTWNGQAWRVDVALDRLRREGRIPDTLVVGIWNHAPLRYAEYFPQKALALADEASRRRYVERAQDGRPLADAYLRFIVEELKPAIDRRFATRPGPETTLVAGSSMGGLISLYALAEYPGVFGGAAALSAHWVGHPTAWGLPQVRNAALPMALLRYFAGTLPAPGRHRLYIDRGDDALDRLYAPALGLAEDLLYERGYTAADAMVRVFEGTGHNESDWAARVDQPLAFLLAGR